MITSLILLIIGKQSKIHAQRLWPFSQYIYAIAVLTLVFYISPELRRIKLILMMKSAPLIHRITWRINLMQIAGMTLTCKKVNLNREEIHQGGPLQGSLVNRKDSKLSCKSYLRLPKERKLKMMMMMLRGMVMDLHYKA